MRRPPVFNRAVIFPKPIGSELEVSAFLDGQGRIKDYVTIVQPAEFRIDQEFTLPGKIVDRGIFQDKLPKLRTAAGKGIRTALQVGRSHGITACELGAAAGLPIQTSSVHLTAAAYSAGLYPQLTADFHGA